MSASGADASEGSSLAGSVNVPSGASCTRTREASSTSTRTFAAPELKVYVSPLRAKPVTSPRCPSAAAAGPAWATSPDRATAPIPAAATHRRTVCLKLRITASFRSQSVTLLVRTVGGSPPDRQQIGAKGAHRPGRPDPLRGAAGGRGGSSPRPRRFLRAFLWRAGPTGAMLGGAAVLRVAGHRVDGAEARANGVERADSTSRT